jgi:16S rRNA pseudouridine516 synthase
MMRLDKFLADMQRGSRAEVKKIIRSGAVTVNDLPVKDPKTKVNPGQDVVAINGVIVQYTQFFYYLLNKPAGVITATKDEQAATVMTLLPKKWQRPDLFPVGRLDKDTTGLLLLTNDGELAHRLLSPRWHVAKVYTAGLDAAIGAAEAVQFSQGIRLKDFTAASAELVPLTHNRAQVTIHEGKFHQVKRMFGAVGRTVLTLKRVQFGPLALPADLREGHARPLTPAEVANLERLTELTRH